MLVRRATPATSPVLKYCSVCALLVQDGPDSNPVDRAADAGHRAECAGRRGTCDTDELPYFEAFGIYQRHVAGGTETDRQRSVYDDLASAHSVWLVVAGARQRLQQDRSQLSHRLSCQVDCYHLVAQRRGTE